MYTTRRSRLVAGAFLLVAVVAVQGWTPPAGATASVGACCLGAVDDDDDDATPMNSGCQNIDPFACEQQGGTFFGSGTSCANVNCDVAGSER